MQRLHQERSFTLLQHSEHLELRMARVTGAVPTGRLIVVLDDGAGGREEDSD